MYEYLSDFSNLHFSFSFFLNIFENENENRRVTPISKCSIIIYIIKLNTCFSPFFSPITLFLFQKLERRKCSVSAIRMVNNRIIVQRSTHSLSFFKLILKTLRGKENRWNRLNGRIIVRRLTRIFFLFFF